MKNFLLLFLAFAIQLFVNNGVQGQSCSLPAATNLKFVQTSNTTGDAAWDKVANASFYQVKLFKVAVTGNQLISTTNTDVPQITLTVPTPGAKYKVDVYAVCSNGASSSSYSSAECQFIIQDDICVLIPTCKSGYLITIPFLPYSTIITPPTTLKRKYSIPWAVNDVVKITLAGTTPMTVFFSFPNTANVCGGSKISWGVYKLGTATITITPSSSQLDISSVTNLLGLTVQRSRCIISPTKQANTSNNPTTLETTDKSQLQAEEITNETEVENLQIAPNPFENYLRLNFENATIKQISLVNQLGQIVKSPAPQQEKNGILDIDTSDLRAGYYYCIVKTESKDYIFKVVKIE